MFPTGRDLWGNSIHFYNCLAIAVKEGSNVGSKQVKGLDDLDFYIGDEAIDRPHYTTKVMFARHLSHYNPCSCSIL